MSEMPSGSQGQSAGQPPSSATNMAMLSHVLGIFLSFLGPLLIWLLKKDEHEFIEDQSREALNWQLTLAVIYIICGILTLVVIGIFLVWLVAIANLIFSIIAAVQASNGTRYRYPFAIRLVK